MLETLMKIGLSISVLFLILNIVSEQEQEKMKNKRRETKMGAEDDLPQDISLF